MELWTLAELAERVEAALADYPGQVNGRVRAVPDGRAIRWYTTIGLVDRPAEMRGRTALYSRRHLLQLVAIKRRQAQGHTLAQIQAELAGATDESLQPIAALIADPPQPTADALRPSRSRFWTDRPTPTPEPAAAELVTAIRIADGVTVVLDHAATTTPDITRLAAAAAPLLAELARQRLLTRPSGDET
ncbi:MerR family transcriptional regulator [Kribbella sp. VKM Ac-2568]|uniref:helix-turn-helix domain-containing protein n=1 Tax=Kribbella sp. VKM Ac-2568 TaxID=2512219 RepID=UPI0010DA1D5F|nr:MerR family transcriptional regulator [Kribbella sp. VKM Ac-2568]TCM48873.1 MerR-like DNA binding protein [Kribbella sp. VKM Ac-2568]